jgi:hypothetical protein
MKILGVVIVLVVGGMISGCWRDRGYDHRGWDDHREHYDEHRERR